MHAYRRLVQEQMDAKGMTQTALATAAGLSRQVVHTIVTDDRDELTELPHRKTVEGLAKAFGLPADSVRSAIAEAMGLPLAAAPSITHEVKDVDVSVLLKELGSRLGLEVTTRPAEGAKPKEAGESKKTGRVARKSSGGTTRTAPDPSPQQSPRRPSQGR